MYQEFGKLVLWRENLQILRCFLLKIVIPSNVEEKNAIEGRVIEAISIVQSCPSKENYLNLVRHAENARGYFLHIGNYACSLDLLQN